MTTLEALEIVLNYKSWDTQLDVPIFLEGEPKEAYDLLVKALTPPTADEVCGAIQRFYGGTIKYEKVSFNLYGYSNAPITLVRLNDGELLFHSKYTLRPHLITLIGRFYEVGK
jgi:hypothetical protein